MAVIDFRGVSNPPYPAEDIYPSETLFPNSLPGGIPAPGVGTPTLVPIIEPVGIPRPGVGTPTLIAGIRPPLRVDFWALADDGSILCPLPHVASWDITMVPGEAGAVTLEYPVDGLHCDELVSRVTAERDLFIRIRTDGTHGTSLGALLYASDGDEIAESATRTFYGRFMTGLLDEAPLPFNPTGEDGEWTWANATAGDILHVVLTILQAGGYLTDLTSTFDGDFDSNGVPWASETSPRFPPGRTALEVAQQLRDWGMVEFEVTADLELRAYEPTAIGRDHTLTDPPMVFRVGRDLAEAPRRTDVSSAATALIVAGAEGVYVEVEDETATAVRGRKIGQFLSEGNLASQAAALAFGELALPRRVRGADERTRSLTFDQDQPVPLRELAPLDWVFDDTGAGLRRDRIAQIQVSQAQGEDRYSGSIVLGQLIDSRDVAIERQLSGLAGGQIITGVSSPSPDVDDGKAPAQVVGLVVSSAPYHDQDHTFAVVTASWLAVTTNFDGTPMSDLSHYEPQFRYPGGTGEWLPLPTVPALTVTWEAVVAGVAIEVRARAVDRFARPGAWSAVAPHTTEDDDTAPPIPSTPVVTNYIGLLRIDWDGLGSAAETMPSDFVGVQVLASETSNFDPDTDPFVQIAVLRGKQSYAWSPPGSLGDADYGTTWYVRLRSVDLTGNVSDLSAQGSAVPGQVEDGDIAEVSVGKLTAGILEAIVTNSGMIRSGDTGARYELDAFGLRFYDAASTLTFQGGGPTGVVEMRGKVTAGAGIGVGSTIIVDPTSPPRLRLYPNASTQRYELTASNYGLPTGGTGGAFQISNVNTSGVETGPFQFFWPAGIWMGHRTTGFTLRGGNIKLEGSGGAGAIIGAESATTGGFIQIQESGSIDFNTGGAGAFFNTDGGTINSDTPFGTGGAGFSMRLQGGAASGVRSVWVGGGGYMAFVDNQGGGGFMTLGDAFGAYKSFVIPHPLEPDDRWLVHACVEAPEAQVEYRGTAVIDGGRADVELPSYFTAATVPGSATVHITMQLPTEPEIVEVEGPPPPAPLPPLAWAPDAPAEVAPEHRRVYSAAASTPDEHGHFRVVSPAPDGTRFAWLVKATRADGPPLVVEPLRSDVDVHGEGPYRHITIRTPQEAA